jgi:hypothetical protein
MKKEKILSKLTASELNFQEAQKRLEQCDDKKRGKLSCKVSQKRAVSVYGLQRLPVTLYAQQWERLLDFGDQVPAFIKEDNSQLNRK